MLATLSASDWKVSVAGHPLIAHVEYEFDVMTNSVHLAFSTRVGTMARITIDEKFANALRHSHGKMGAVDSLFNEGLRRGDVVMAGDSPEPVLMVGGPKSGDLIVPKNVPILVWDASDLPVVCQVPSEGDALASSVKFLSYDWEDVFFVGLTGTQENFKVLRPTGFESDDQFEASLNLCFDSDPNLDLYPSLNRYANDRKYFK